MNPPFSSDLYNRALLFAANAHKTQRFPGSDLPYLLHVVSVAGEILACALAEKFDVELAVTCALLHDTLEDTEAKAEDIEAAFGPRVLAGVRALSKNQTLPKPEQMPDSLSRIAALPREIAMVKLADRITNLQSPPHYWTREKCTAYREEAMHIADALGHASAFLGARIREKIAAYRAFTE